MYCQVTVTVADLAQGKTLTARNTLAHKPSFVFVNGERVIIPPSQTVAITLTRGINLLAGGVGVELVLG